MPPENSQIVYQVQFDTRIIRELRRVPAPEQERILSAIDRLSTNPKPKGAKKLVNQPGWRIRIGNYRVLYEIMEREKIVRIYRAGHRRDVYR